MHRVFICIAVASLAAACGGGGGAHSPAGLESGFDVEVTPRKVVALPGSSTHVRVDLRSQTHPDAPVGYAFDFDEVAADIDVATAPCPSNIGTVACQDWSITAGPNAVPGHYLVLVRAVGTRFTPHDTDETTARFELIVTASPPSRGAVFVDGGNGPDALVITDDGRLWGNGKNHRGQLDVGYEFVHLPDDHPPNDDRPSGIQIQPVRSAGFVRVQPEATERWSVASVYADTRFAVQAFDGSLWGWGGNFGHYELGLPRNDRGVESRPVRIPGVTGVAQIAQGPHGTLVRTAARGSVYAIGGQDGASSLEHELLFGATPVPAAFVTGSTTEVAPLTTVASIGGSAAVDGAGFGIAAKLDGSVWMWGARPYLKVDRDGVTTYDPVGFPERVTDLPADIEEVAGLDGGAHSIGVFVARTASGIVWEGGAGFIRGSDPGAPATLDIAPSTRVPGLADVVEVTIGRADSDNVVGLDVALARLRDGAVFAWVPGETTPRRVTGIPPAIRLGRGHVISGDCSGLSGAVWKVRITDESATAAPTGTFGFREPSCATAAGRLTVDVTGPGRVTTIAQLIDCGNLCSNAFPLGSAVTLLAVPEPGYEAHYPATPSCDRQVLYDGTAGVIVGENTRCAVNFEAAPTAHVSVQRYGQGSITSSPAGIDCGPTCVADFPLTGRTSAATPLGPTIVRLLPQPATGWRVASLAGACDSTGVITIAGVISAPEPSYGCSVTFERIPTSIALTASRSGDGSGTVTSAPAGIDCGDTCSASFAFDSIVQMRAVAAAGSRFDGWDGDADCRDGFVRADRPKTCVALFSIVVPPHAPTGLRAVADDFGVELTWDRNDAATSYQLTRTPGSDGNASRTFLFPGPAQRYVDNTVSSDTLYRYELVASNAGGSSAAATASARTTVAADWTRIGSNDIDATIGFAQPALALTADGNSVAVAQVVTGGAFEQPHVFVNDTFAPNPWTHLNGTPGESIVPAAAATQPTLALTASGTPFVAWTQATATGTDVRVARYDSQAAQWTLLGGPLDIDLGSAAQNDATQPVIALDTADRPVVAWLQAGIAFAKGWNGSAWVPVGDAGGVAPGATIDAVKLMLDSDGIAYLLARRGTGIAAQLFAYRESASGWAALGGALNAPLIPLRNTLSFFDLITDAEGAPLAVWSEGIAPHNVLASRWSNGTWQRLPDIVNSDTGHALTGLAAARSVQAATIQPSPPHVMLTTQPVFDGANRSNGFGDVYFLNAGVWESRPTLLTRGPMLGLTLRITRQATPVAAWIAETGALGSGELRLFVWRSLF